MGMLALTDNEPVWEAAENRPGTYYMPITLHDQRVQRLLTTVHNIKTQLDFLIVAAHWGPNWGSTPPPAHMSFGRALINAGADIIFGHSGHIVRGIEIYHGCPILYCAGDFIDDYAIDPYERNDLGFIFLLELEGTQMTRFLLYPTSIKQYQVQLAHGTDRDTIVSMMQQRCAALGTPILWSPLDERFIVPLR